LPVNLVIIIVVAVLVLLAAAAFFAGGFSPSSGTITDSAAWQKGCGMAIARGCGSSLFENTENGLQIPSYDPSGNGLDQFQDSTLNEACKRVFQISDSGMDSMTAPEYCKFKCCGIKPATEIS